jgi:hypothetical protein
MNLTLYIAALYCECTSAPQRGNLVAQALILHLLNLQQKNNRLSA